MPPPSLLVDFGLEHESSLEWVGCPPGGEYLRTIHLRNTGTRSLHLRYILPRARQFFMAFPDPIIIQPGLTRPIEVRFRPTRWEEIQDSVAFTVEHQGTFSIPVSALLARLSVSLPGALDFGSVPVNEASSLGVTLANTGETDALYEFEVGAPFQVAPRSGRLAPGAAVLLTVTVAPREACCLRAAALCRIQGGEQTHTLALAAVSKYAHIALGGVAAGTGAGAGAGSSSSLRGVGREELQVLDGSRARLLWGDVTLGTAAPTLERTVTILNDGSVPACVDCLAGEEGGAAEQQDSLSQALPRHCQGAYFSATPPSVPSVPPGGAATFTLRLHAATAGASACQAFRFCTPGGNAITVTAHGRVTGPLLTLARRDRAGNLVYGAVAEAFAGARALAAAAVAEGGVGATGGALGAAGAGTSSVLSLGSSSLLLPGPLSATAGGGGGGLGPGTVSTGGGGGGGASSCAPHLSPSPLAPRHVLSLGFGDSPVDTPVTHVVVLSNTSPTVPASWAALQAEDAGVFTLSTSRGTLGPGGSTSLAVTFQAAAPGNYHRRLFIACAHGPLLALDVLGTAYSDKARPNPLRQRHIDAARLRPPPLRLLAPDALLPVVQAGGGADAGSRSREAEWLLQAFPSPSGDCSRAVGAAYAELFTSPEDSSLPVHLSTQAIEFLQPAAAAGAGGGRGLQGLTGSSERHTVTVHNRMNVRSCVSWVVPVSRTPAGAAARSRDFTVTPAQCEVDACGSAQFQVTFTPTLSSFYYSATLEAHVAPKVNRSFRLVDEESFVPPVCLPLQVVGHTFPDAQSFVPRASTCFGGAALEQALALPPAVVGGSTYYTFKLTNSSEVPARFAFTFPGAAAGAGAAGAGSSPSPPHPVFSVLPASGLIPAREFALVTVRFSPRAPRAYSGLLLCELNRHAGNSLRIALGGAGALPRLALPADGLLYIKPTCLGLRSSRTFSLRNPGPVPARYEFTVPAAQAGVLSVSPATGDIVPGGSCDITLSYAPVAAGPLRAALALAVYPVTGSATDSQTLLTALAENLAGAEQQAQALAPAPHPFAFIDALEARMHGVDAECGEEVSSEEGGLVSAHSIALEGSSRGSSRGVGRSASALLSASVARSSSAAAAAAPLTQARAGGAAPTLDLSSLATDSLLQGGVSISALLPTPRGDGSLLPPPSDTLLLPPGSVPARLAPRPATSAMAAAQGAPLAPPPTQRLLLSVHSEASVGALRFTTPALDFGAACVGSSLAGALCIENTSDVELRWRVDGVVQVTRSGLDWDASPELSAPSELDEGGEGGGQGAQAAQQLPPPLLLSGPGLAQPGDIRKEWQAARALAEAALRAEDEREGYGAAGSGGGGGGRVRAPPPPFGAYTRTLALRLSEPGVQYPVVGGNPLEAEAAGSGAGAAAAAADFLDDLAGMARLPPIQEAGEEEDRLSGGGSGYPSFYDSAGSVDGGGLAAAATAAAAAAAAAATASGSRLGASSRAPQQQRSSPLLTFDPPTGTLPPHSTQRITVTFRPAYVALHRFRVYTETLTASNSAGRAVGGGATARGSEYGDVQGSAAGRAAVERAPLHYLPGSAVSRGAAFAAAAAASASRTDPAAAHVEAQAPNASPLYADITARGALPFFSVEDAAACSSREAYLATLPSQWRGAQQVHCEAFAGAGGSTGARVVLNEATRALVGGGSGPGGRVAAPLTARPGSSGGSGSGSGSSAQGPLLPPPLPQALALLQHLRGSPVSDFWVRPEGVLAEGIHGGWGVPAEAGGGHPWSFAMPCETLWRSRGLGGGGMGSTGMHQQHQHQQRGSTQRLLHGGAAIEEHSVTAAVFCALEGRTRTLTLPLSKLTPPLPSSLAAHFATFLPLERIALQRRALGLGAAAQALAAAAPAASAASLAVSAAALTSPYTSFAPSPALPLSPHRLWLAFSLRELNGYLAGRLSPEEAAFNASAPISRDPTSLAAFPFEFPPAPLGSPPCLVLLQLRNTSHLPVHLSISLPTEAPVPAEPWSLEMDEPSADELADHELCDRSVFGVFPRTLMLAPGAAAPIRLHYAYATLLNDGRHEITVLLRVRGGKPVRLLLRGLTLPPARPYLYSGLPSRALTLPPVPLGLAAPPVHLLHLRNPSSTPLRYALLPGCLAALAAASYGRPVLRCSNPRGCLLPGEEGALHITFCPLESKAYSLQLLVGYAACTWPDSAAGAGGVVGEGGEESQQEEQRAVAEWLGEAALEDIVSRMREAEAEREGEEGGSKAAEAEAEAEEAEEAEVEVEASVRAARARRQAALGKHQDADVNGYESELPGLLVLRVSGLGYQPGGISMGGKAAMPLVPSVPPVALGVPLPTPPQPSPLDALSSATGAAASRSGLPPRYSAPASTLLHAAFLNSSPAAAAILTADALPNAQRLCGSLSRLASSVGGGPWGGSRATGGACAASDALWLSAVSALGLDGASAAVSVGGNIVDKALRLGLVAAAGGRAAAAAAYRVLLFGPGGEEEGEEGQQQGQEVARDGSLEEGSALTHPYEAAEGGGSAGFLPLSSSSSSSSTALSLAAAASTRLANAQLRHSQAVLQALATAGGSAAAAAGEPAMDAAAPTAASLRDSASSLRRPATALGGGSAVLASLAAEEVRAATAVSRRSASRPHAPYAGGYQKMLGQAPLPPTGIPCHTLPPQLAARLYPLVTRLAAPHATAHLYRPGQEPARFHGAEPPLRQWLPALHGDAPEGFARLSSGGRLALGDVPVRHGLSRWVVLRNVRGEVSVEEARAGGGAGSSSSSSSSSSVTGAGGAEPIVHFSWDCAHPLVAGGCLRITPSAGTLPPGQAALCRLDFQAPPHPILLATDIACCVSASPQELQARAVSALTRAWEGKGAAAAAAARAGAWAAAPHVLTASKSTASARAKIAGRAREAAVRAHLAASAGESLKGKSVYAVLSEGAALGAGGAPLPLGATALARVTALNSTRGTATPSSRNFAPPSRVYLPPGTLSLAAAKASPLIPPPLSQVLVPKGSARAALVAMGVLPGEGAGAGAGAGQGEGGVDEDDSASTTGTLADDDVGSQTATVGEAGPRLRAEGAAERAARESSLLARSRGGAGGGGAAASSRGSREESGGLDGSALDGSTTSYLEALELGSGLPGTGLNPAAGAATGGAAPTLSAEAALAYSMIQAVVHAGGPAVAALSLTGALPPGAAALGKRAQGRSLAEGSAAPRLASDEASMRRGRIAERARLRAALPRVHVRDESGGEGAWVGAGGRGEEEEMELEQLEQQEQEQQEHSEHGGSAEAASSAAARRAAQAASQAGEGAASVLLGGAQPLHPSLSLLPPPPHAVLWLHLSARVASLPEYTQAYSSAHLAGFVPPPLLHSATPAAAAAEAARLAAAVHSAAPQPPARLIASLMTTLLEEIAQDPLLHASASRWGGGPEAPSLAAATSATAAAAARATLATAPASTSASAAALAQRRAAGGAGGATSASSAWGSEAGLVAGGLTFAALRAAGGDTQAALTAVRAQGEAALAVAASLSASRGSAHSLQQRPVTAPAAFASTGAAPAAAAVAAAAAATAASLPALTAQAALGVLSVAAPNRGGGGAAGSPGQQAGGLLRQLAPVVPREEGGSGSQENAHRAAAAAVGALYDTSLPGPRSGVGAGGGDVPLGSLPGPVRAAMCSGGGALFCAAASAVLMGVLGEIGEDMVRGAVEWAPARGVTSSSSRSSTRGVGGGGGARSVGGGGGSPRSAFGGPRRGTAPAPGGGSSSSSSSGHKDEELVLDAEEEALLRRRAEREVVYSAE